MWALAVHGFQQQCFNDRSSSERPDIHTAKKLNEEIMSTIIMNPLSISASTFRLDRKASRRSKFGKTLKTERSKKMCLIEDLLNELDPLFADEIQI